MSDLNKIVIEIKKKMADNSRELNRVVERIDNGEDRDETWDLYHFLRGKNKAYSQVIEELRYY